MTSSRVREGGCSSGRRERLRVQARGRTYPENKSSARRRRVRGADLDDRHAIDLVDFALEQVDQLDPDFDDELVDRASVLALQDVDGDDVSPDRTDAAGDQPQG